MATKKKPSKALTVAEQKQIARLASRPDAPKVMRLRLWLLDKLEEHKDEIFDQIMATINLKGGALGLGHRDYDPAVKLLMRLLDTLLPAQREVIQAPEESQDKGPLKGATIKIYNVNRGTEAAREKAIVIDAQKRARAVA